MAKTIKYILTVDSKGAVKSVRTADGEMRKLEKQVDDVGKAGKRMGRVFEVAMGNLAANAVAGLTRAVGNLARNGFRLLSRSVQLRGIQQIAERKLEQALRNLGDGAEEAAPRLFEVARQMQAVSNFGDETIITAQAMLASFKEVAGPEGIEILTPRLLDMAAGVTKVTGESIDLNQVAAMLGKSLSDSAAVLKRVGVSLTDTQMAALNAAEGLDKVNLLAEVIDSNFKGLATTIADPFKQLENAAGDLLEEIGKGLRPELELLAKDIQQWIESGDVQELALFIGEKLGGAIRDVAGFIRDNQDVWSDLGTEISGLGSNFAEIVRVLSGDESVNSGMDAFRLIAEGVTDEIDDLNRAIELMVGWADKLTGAMEANERAANNAGAAIRRWIFGGTGSGQLPETPIPPPDPSVFMRSSNGSSSSGSSSTPQPSGPPRARGRAIEQSSQNDPLATLLGPGTDMQADMDLFQLIADGAVIAAEQTDVAAEALARYGEGLMAATEQAIFNKEMEDARREALEQSIASQIAAADTSIMTAQDAANATVMAVRQVIQAKLAELIAKNLASLGPAALFIGPAVAAGLNLLFNNLIPQFADGVTGFRGGLALVGERGPELVSLPGGSNVITNENTQKLMGGGNLAREVRLMRMELQKKQFHLRGADLQTSGKRQRSLYARAGIK